MSDDTEEICRLNELLDEMMEREMARAEGRPLANGYYPHLVICSGNPKAPLGEPGCVCDRRYSALRAKYEKMRKELGNG